MSNKECEACGGSGEIDVTQSTDTVRSFTRCTVCCGKGFIDVLGTDWPRVVNTVKLDSVAWPEPMYLSDGDFDPEDVKRLMEAPGGTFNAVHCTGHVDCIPESAIGRLTVVDDIELTNRALLACGYRVHTKERNGTRWATAVKGLEVQYKHWHPLTNINQAMQLLIDANVNVSVGPHWVFVETEEQCERLQTVDGVQRNPQDLINAQCRAIVTACAALEPVR